MRRAWIAAALAVVALLAVVLILRDDTPPVLVDTGAPPVLPAPADAGADDATSELHGWVAAEPRPGDFVARVDGRPVDAAFVIGAAGVYPPLRTTGGRIALPVSPDATDDPTDVEVYARALDGSRAFWGDTPVDSDGVDLGPAQPLSVRVLDPRGTPRANATVRLARETVGLVVLSAETDPDGLATFDAVPPGEYWATATVAGLRSASSSVLTDSETVIMLEPGRDVSGLVKLPDGSAVEDAVVAIHGGGIGSNPLDDVPMDIVHTDVLGRFHATGIDGAQVVAVAIVPGWAPASASAEAAEGPVQIDIVMRPSESLGIDVVDSSDKPVPAARVEWTDELGFGATALTDAKGRAVFRDVPASASVRAVFGRFESALMDLAAMDPQLRSNLRLQLDTADMRIWRYRVRTPENVVLRDLSARDARGARCSVSTNDGRDFTLESCGDGDAAFRAITDRGVVEWNVSFVDGKDIDLPKPTPVEVRVVGKPDEDWAETYFSLVGTSAVGAPIETRVERDGMVLSTAVYPGDWQLGAGNPRVGRQQFEITVETSPVKQTIELVALHLFRVIVVDSYGAPVTGASVMLFGEETPIDIKRSAGELPVELRVRPPFDGTVIAIDPRRGEGRASVSTSGDGDEIRIALRETVLRLATPAGRPDAPTLARLTGAELVERDRGYVLDVQPQTPAARAGLERGDSVVTAWPERRGTRVVVYRKGAGYVDVLVK